MADADKYKPQDGDVDEWVTKIQAMAEAVAKGETDTAEILAFLATNPGFAPVGNPTAQSSQYSYIATTSDNALYTITDANPYTSLAGGELFIITFPAANTGAVDIKVDALAQKNLFKDGAALGGGEAEGTHVVQYDLANDRMNMIEGRSTGITILNIDNTDSPYTVKAADFKSPFLRILADASAGDVVVKAPTPANYKNKELIVIANVDPAGNKVETQKSGGTEWHISVAKGDFVKVMSDGTSESVLDHYEGHYCRVYVNANEPIAQGASEQIIGISATTDKGGIWNTANDEVDVPFDCWVDPAWTILTLGEEAISPTMKIDAAFVRDLAASVSTQWNYGGSAPGVFSHRFPADSGNKIELWATNLDSDSGGANVLGDAAGDESFATIKLTRRY